MTNEIAELSTDIHVITAEINAYQRVAGEAIFEIGRRLKHVKENDLVHGQWQKWCDTEINISGRHALRFIQIYERFKDSPISSELPKSVCLLVALRTFSDAEIMSDIPQDDGTTKKLYEMSTREIDKYKKKVIRGAQQQAKSKKINSTQNPSCFCCGNKFVPFLHLHHIVPVHQCGDNSDENTVLLCPNCHSILHGIVSDKYEQKYGLDNCIKLINEQFGSTVSSRIMYLLREHINRLKEAT